MEIQNTLKSQNSLEKEEQELTVSASLTSDYNTSYSNQNTGTATKIKTGSFPVSQFFKSDGQSIGVSALASVLLMNIQD